MPDKIKRLSVGVGRKHLVTMRKTSLMGLSIMRVWALQHQTGAQCSAVEWTKAIVAVQSTVASAPQFDSADLFKNPPRNVSFFHSDSKCRRNVSVLSSFMPRYMGSAQNGRACPLTKMLSSRRASLF